MVDIKFQFHLLILSCFYFLYSVCFMVGIWLEQVGPWQISGNNPAFSSFIFLSHLWHVLNCFQIIIELTIVTSYVLVPLFVCMWSLLYLIVIFLCSDFLWYFWLLCVFLMDCFLRQDSAFYVSTVSKDAQSLSPMNHLLITVSPSTALWTYQWISEDSVLDCGIAATGIATIPKAKLQMISSLLPHPPAFLNYQVVHPSYSMHSLAVIIFFKICKLTLELWSHQYDSCEKMCSGLHLQIVK